MVSGDQAELPSLVPDPSSLVQCCSESPGGLRVSPISSDLSSPSAEGRRAVSPATFQLLDAARAGGARLSSECGDGFSP